ncbi:MAG: hypothetical protein KA368_03125 [Acidobacteria bacterium]|nr:hypothetical protein [Acidobacteriota bacterium]
MAQFFYIAKLLLGLFILITISLMAFSWLFPDETGSSDYAIEAVKLPDGENVYFKREIRGLTGNYDVIAVSANSDPCASCDRKKDYCLNEMWPEAVYYKIEAGTLHLFAYRGISIPEKFPLPIKIETHEISGLPAQREFESKMERNGIKKLPLTAASKCR